MTTFDDRENAFEARFAHDEATKFRALARRDRLVGEWAAARLGLSGEAAESYAKQVILSDLEKPGDDDIVAKLLRDLAPLGLDEAAIRAALVEQEGVARAQIVDEA